MEQLIDCLQELCYTHKEANIPTKLDTNALFFITHKLMCHGT